VFVISALTVIRGARGALAIVKIIIQGLCAELRFVQSGDFRNGIPYKRAHTRMELRAVSVHRVGTVKRISLQYFWVDESGQCWPAGRPVLNAS